MKLPEILLFRLKDKTIYCSPRFFGFLEAKMLNTVPIEPLEIKLKYDADINPYVIQQLQKKLNNINLLKENIDHVYLNSTDICLGTCKYCYADNKQKNILTFQQLTNTLTPHYSLDQIKTYTLLGGEPLLNQKLILSLLKETKALLSISTGLFLPNTTFNKFLNILDKYSHRIQLSVSIDPENDKRQGLNKNLLLSRALQLLNYNTRIKSTLCSGAINYPKLRNYFEQKLQREVTLDFDLVSQDEYFPTSEEISHIIAFVIKDIHAYLNKERIYVPQYIIDLAHSLQSIYTCGDKNFIVNTGCGILTDSIVVDSIGNITKCCEPIKHTNFSIPIKCYTCPILRYCGLRCYVNSNKKFMCTTSYIKTICALYLFAWRTF